MKLITSSGLLALCALTLSACGGDSKGSPGSSTSSSASQVDPNLNSQSGNCGSTVISDYNTYVLRCKYMTTDDDVRNCKSTAQSLLNKYPGLSCQAAQEDSSSVDQQPITIQASKVQSVIDKITAAGY